MQILKVNTDFTMYPGARYYSDGSFSGEEFFDKKLKEAFQDALNNNEKLIVDLDGTAGYASSFLSESFGLLAEEFGKDIVLKNIEIVSNNEPDWKTAILDNYIPSAEKRKKKPVINA